MRPHITLVRVVGGQFLADMFMPLVWVVAGVLAVLFAVGIWLTTVNVWWWLLVGILVLLMPLAALLFVTVMFVIRTVRPQLDHRQKLAVRAFTDKLRATVEDVRTPWPWIAAKIAYDVVFPSKNGYLTRLIASSKTLYPDYRQLQDSFEDR